MYTYEFNGNIEGQELYLEIDVELDIETTEDLLGEYKRRVYDIKECRLYDAMELNKPDPKQLSVEDFVECRQLESWIGSCKLRAIDKAAEEKLK